VTTVSAERSEQARAWARGEITMTQARTAAFAAHAAAREAFGTIVAVVTLAMTRYMLGN